MDKIVVDTNVWVTAGKLAADVETIDELDCVEACIDWTQEFIDGDLRLLVDTDSKVVDEYMNHISKRRYPDSNLNELYTNIWEHIEPINIQFDESGYALLRLTVSFHDPADRKFVALALACDPYAPIYNAADTDWARERQNLEIHGLTVHELCPEYIKNRIK